MFDTIILLTGPIEQTALAAVLRNHNPQLTILAASTLAELDALEPALLHRARLIGFVTPIIVPARTIKELGFGAYNFHPGPPHYPGWMPSHFAIYDRAREFGATAHVMVERVDAGPIVGVDLFDVPSNAGVAELEQLTFARLAQLFWKLAKPLATQHVPLEELPARWSGRKSTQRMFAALCDITPDIEQTEIDRRVHAFGAGIFGRSLTITLHGRQFRYVSMAPDTEAEAPRSEPDQQSALDKAS